MSQKKYNKFHLYLFYINLPELKFPRIASKSPYIFSLKKSVHPKFGNTGRFFKKLAFVGLAMKCLNFSKGANSTMKSIMLSLWNTIATYTFIF